MAIRHGRNAGIYINGVDLSGDVNAVSVNSEQELADITTFGQVGHTLYPGLAKDSGTIEALFNSTSAAVFNSMVQIDPSYPMMITFGQSLGDPAYGANEAMLNNHSIKSVVSDVNRVNFTFDVDNYPFEPGVLLTTGKQTTITAGNNTSADNASASATTGGAAYLHVFGVSTGALTVSIRASSTDAWAGEQVTTCTFTAVSTSGIPNAQRIAITSQIARYARAYWLNTGSTCTFAVSLTRY